jgi:hypothetical protein
VAGAQRRSGVGLERSGHQPGGVRHVCGTGAGDGVLVRRSGLVLLPWGLRVDTGRVPERGYCDSRISGATVATVATVADGRRPV